jgi:hypothetical protein
MFRENSAHLQTELFNTSSTLNPKIQEKLLKSWAPQFYEMVFCRIDETCFAPLYCGDNGRPNTPVNVLLSLEFLKHMKNLTDEELIEEFHFNYQFNYALGYRNLGELHIAPRTLYEFRERIVAYTKAHPEEEDLIFCQFQKLTDGFVTAAHIKQDKQRGDSTQISAHIKRAGRLSLAFDVLQRAVKAIPSEIFPDFLKPVLEPSFKTDALYRSKGNEAKARMQQIVELCSQTLEYYKSKKELFNLPEVQLLDRFLKEQTKTDETGALRAKDNKEIAPTSLQSAYEEDATYRSKGKKGHVGYVLNLVETCAKENPAQLITDYTLEQNRVSDVDMILDRLPLLAQRGVKDLYLDGGFYGEKVQELADLLNIRLHYTDMTGGKSKSSKLPVTAFEFKDLRQVLRCPAGHAPVKTNFHEKSSLITAQFDVEKCRACPFRSSCPIESDKKKTKFKTTVKALRATRTGEELKTKGIRREATSMRAAIEGTNSSLKRAQGAGRSNVRGLIKTALVTGMKIIGHNFKQFLRAAKKVAKNAAAAVAAAVAMAPEPEPAS